MVEAKHSERDFDALFPVGEALALLLHPYGEVVLHDNRSGNIVRIWNAFSDRKAGDASHLEGAPDLFTTESVLGPYEKALGGQGRTKSVTAAIRDGEGTIVGFFCVNLDVSTLDAITDTIKNFVSFPTERPEPIYRNDLQEHVNYMIRDYLISANKRAENLNRQERLQLIREFDKSGLFSARNSVNLVAKALGISRTSVYNMLGRSKANNSS